MMNGMEPELLAGAALMAWNLYLTQGRMQNAKEHKELSAEITRLRTWKDNYIEQQNELWLEAASKYATNDALIEFRKEINRRFDKLEEMIGGKPC